MLQQINTAIIFHALTIIAICLNTSKAGIAAAIASLAIAYFHELHVARYGVDSYGHMYPSMLRFMAIGACAASYIIYFFS